MPPVLQVTQGRDGQRGSVLPCLSPWWRGSGGATSLMQNWKVARALSCHLHITQRGENFGLFYNTHLDRLDIVKKQDLMLK